MEGRCSASVPLLFPLPLDLSPCFRPGGGRHETDVSNFRRCAEALRRTPIARAAADVDPEIVEAMQARGKRLQQLHYKIPRKELTAVRVSGELQVEAGLRRGESGLWLVREQNLDTRPRRRTCDGRGGVAAVRGSEMMCAVVGFARDPKRSAAFFRPNVLR